MKLKNWTSKHFGYCQSCGHFISPSGEYGGIDDKHSLCKKCFVKQGKHLENETYKEED